MYNKNGCMKKYSKTCFGQNSLWAAALICQAKTFQSCISFTKAFPVFDGDIFTVGHFGINVGVFVQRKF